MRVQDGAKRFLLCSSCEQLFSRHEKSFADKLFYPYLAESGGQFKYSSWLLHFCTSVSWRVLQLALEDEHLNEWEPEALARVVEAETAWREFLLGKRPHPGQFRQHLLPTGQASSVNGNFSSNINRYLMRAIHMDICNGTDSIFTYSKLGRFIILGFVHEQNLNHWRGTKVHATAGIIEPRQYVLPKAFGEYLNDQAKKLLDAHRSVSERQQAKIDQAFRANAAQYIGSDAFTAMQTDIELFGNDAFAKRTERA